MVPPLSATPGKLRRLMRVPQAPSTLSAAIKINDTIWGGCSGFHFRCKTRLKERPKGVLRLSFSIKEAEGRGDWKEERKVKAMKTDRRKRGRWRTGEMGRNWKEDEGLTKRRIKGDKKLRERKLWINIRTIYFNSTIFSIHLSIIFNHFQ